MRKIIFLILFPLVSFASFLDKDFKANITETNGKYEKVYDISYSEDKIVLKMIKPDINKGEIYTYKNGKKYIYYPSLDQTVLQSLSAQDTDIINILKKLKSVKKSSTIKGVKYIVQDSNIRKIISKSYEAQFIYNSHNMPIETTVKANGVITRFIWKY